MRALVFPGQGGQYKGMGAELWDSYTKLEAMADDVLGYSIRMLCMEDEGGRLRQTEFTQPAMFVVNAMCGHRKIEQHGRPDYVAGHSLGEYNALYATGVLDFSSALRLVHRRAQLMSKADGGSMVAILGLDEPTIMNAVSAAGLLGIDVANINTRTQIVLSGPSDEIGRAEHVLAKKGADCVPLNTSGAFHSRYMRPFKEEFSALLQEQKYNSPSIPIVSSVTATPATLDNLVQILADQMSSTVRWYGSVLYLLNAGCNEFVEAGPGSVLSNIISKIRADEGAKKREAKLTAPKHALLVDCDEPVKHDLRKDVNAVVSEWNRRHDVGSSVNILSRNGELGKTRTEAVVLFGHRAAVYLDGYNGYFPLTDLRPE